MRTKIANWTRLAVVVVLVASTQSGCKSGWKMPGADMFSWSRKPSESTLAGSSPSLSMPTSPAQRNTPSPLNSTAASGARSGSPYGTTTPNQGASFAMGGPGSAASANGYSNGPYGMVGNQTRPNTPAYGGPSTGYVANNTAGGFGSSAAPNSSFAGAQPPSLPPAYGGQPNMGTNNAAYAAMGNNSIPAMPAGYNAVANAMPNPTAPQSTSMPNALSTGYQPSMPSVATQAYNGATPYRPGSVGRSTAYDFSNQGPGGVANTSLPAPNGLPSSVPNTANNPAGLPSPTYR